VVEIELDALFEGELREAFVIVVLLKDDYVCFGERFDDSTGDGRFAGACASADSDDEWARVERSYGWRSYFFFFGILRSSITAWAAARRAMGTQKGVALT
jgi:hypothetical protein